MADNSDKKKEAEIYFRVKGDPAELFERCREEAKKHPEFWHFAQLSRADFGRHLMMKALVPLGKQLGLLKDDGAPTEPPDDE